MDSIFNTVKYVKVDGEDHYTRFWTMEEVNAYYQLHMSPDKLRASQVDYKRRVNSSVGWLEILNAAAFEKVEGYLHVKGTCIFRLRHKKVEKIPRLVYDVKNLFD